MCAAANVLDATPRSRNVLWVWLRYSTTHLLHCTLLLAQPPNLGSRRARKGTRVHAIHVRMPHVERCKCPAVYADEIFVPNRSRTYVAPPPLPDSLTDLCCIRVFSIGESFVACGCCNCTEPALFACSERQAARSCMQVGGLGNTERLIDETSTPVLMRRRLKQRSTRTTSDAKTVRNSGQVAALEEPPCLPSKSPVSGGRCCCCCALRLPFRARTKSVNGDANDGSENGGLDLVLSLSRCFLRPGLHFQGEKLVRTILEKVLAIASDLRGPWV